MFKIFVSLLVMIQKPLNAFRPVTENSRVLVGHVFHHLYSADWFNCIQACHDEPRCISYNYQRSAGANGLCELNDCGVEHSCNRDKLLIYSGGFVFQQIRESKISMLDNPSAPHNRPSPSGPSAPPTNLRAVNKTTNSIRVTWYGVPPSGQNGDVINYTVIYQSQQLLGQKVVTVDAGTCFVNLTGLEENTYYTIRVFAKYGHVAGPQSDTIDVATADPRPFQCPLNYAGETRNYQDPNSCFRYYKCSNGIKSHLSCPPGEEFQKLDKAIVGGSCVDGRPQVIPCHV